MLATFAICALFCVVLASFLGACLAIAFLLRWLVPSMDLGIGAVLAAIGLLSARRIVAWMSDQGSKSAIPRTHDEHAPVGDSEFPLVFVKPRPRRRSKPRPSDSSG
jgi:hypothetical protein